MHALNTLFALLYYLPNGSQRFKLRFCLVFYLYFHQNVNCFTYFCWIDAHKQRIQQQNVLPVFESLSEATDTDGDGHVLLATRCSDMRCHTYVKRV